MVMCVVGAMRAGSHGSEIASEVQNLCVCGTYQRIKLAVTTL
jgi:isoquinoline 1-oxidoreductase alpha subunit